MSKYLFHGGPIHTMFEQHPTDGVLLTENDIIVFVGPAGALSREQRRNAEPVDLAGRPLLPGFCDSHLHLLLSAEEHAAIDCRGVSSIDEVRRLVAGEARIRKPENWITGHGWERKTLFTNQVPSLTPLDEAAPRNPVFLMSKDVHSAWLNSSAMDRMHSMDRPPGKCIVHRLNGRESGLVLEDVLELRRRLIPPLGERERLVLLRPFIRHLHRHGITSVHCNEPVKDLLLFKAYLRQATDRIRALWNPVFESPEDLLDRKEMLDLMTPGWLGTGGIKLFIDGTLGSLTAALNRPYSGTEDNRGVMVMAEEELMTWLRAIRSAGTYGVFHVIGDRAAGLVLDAISRMDWPEGLMHRLEHAQFLPQSALAAHSVEGLIFSVQPSHMWGDRDIVDENLPPELAGRPAYAYRTMIEKGGILVFGSDSPVEEVDVWRGIQAAVTRLEDERSEPWNPGERLTLRQAIESHTTEPARVHGHCFQTGCLAPGRKADLVILNDDPFLRSPADLGENVRVEMTFLDGAPVYPC